MKKLNLLTFLIVISFFTYAQQLQKGSVAYYESLRITYQTKIDWVNSNPEEKALAEQNHWFEMANANVQKMIDYKYLAEQSRNGIYLPISNSNRSLNEYTPQGGGPICSEAAPICLGNTYEWPCSSNVPSAESGPDYGCLASEPNPVWYYFQIENSGDIVMGMDAPNDVDYVIWGPFTEGPNCDYADLQMEYVVDCFYSSTNTESPEIGPNSSEGPTTATAGEWYMIMITNYSNDEQNFIFYQTGGTGSTNCDILCPLQANNFNYTFGDCEPHQTGDTYWSEYDLSGSISFIENVEFDSIAFFRNGNWFYSEVAPLNSPINFTIDNLPSDSANTITATLYIDADSLCQAEMQFTTPSNCAYCDAIAGEDFVACDNSFNLNAIFENGDYNTLWVSSSSNITFEEETEYSTTVENINNLGTDTCLLIWNKTNFMNLTCSDTIQAIFIANTVELTDYNLPTEGVCDGNIEYQNYSSSTTYATRFANNIGFSGAEENVIGPLQTTLSYDLCVGEYFVEYTNLIEVDGNVELGTCIDTLYVNLGQFPDACNNLHSNLEINHASIGNNDASVNVTPIGGTSPYTYSWTGPNSFTSNTQNIDNLEIGIYVLNLSDNASCSETRHIYIYEQFEEAVFDSPVDTFYTNSLDTCIDFSFTQVYIYDYYDTGDLILVTWAFENDFDVVQFLTVAYDVTFGGTGAYTFMLPISCGNKSINNYYYSVYYNPDVYTQLNNMVESNFSIFPNPAKNIVTIDFEDQQSGIIQIYSLSGQIIKEQIFENSNKENINIEALEKGVYLVKVKQKGSINTKRIVVE